MRAFRNPVFAFLLSFPWSFYADDLSDLAEAQNWRAVEKALTEKADPNAAQPDGTTALHWAAYHDREQVVKTLLEAGGKPDARNRFDATPLSLACTNGNAVTAGLLIEAGADPNRENRGAETPLMIAARTGKPDLVKLLLDREARIDATNDKGQTSLMWAAAEGHADVVKILIGAGADPQKPLKSGLTPLLFAAREGKIEVVKILLDSGVDVNSVTQSGGGGRRPPKGTSALRFAVENGHFELATVLLKAGADPNDQRSGLAPLHLLSKVRKPNRGDDFGGMPPPTGSGKLTSLEFAELLLTKFRADPNSKLKRGSSGGHKLGTKGATPSLLAAKTADLAFLKLLAENGADLRITNEDGTTPLMAAAGQGTHAPTEEAGTEEECLETVAWLLGQGADINAVDKNGETAMHGAAYKSLPKMVAFLAENGADIKIWNRKNKRGRTPLLLAQGFRPGNFKPAPATIEAVETVMRAEGVEPPEAPPRPAVGKPKKYEN
ncbi:MAG: hypothetical protein HKN23_08645 [Verrucomicrobiales bacterium]|nr:hypothetical protein [Verrucomicrobiales bacterium]